MECAETKRECRGRVQYKDQARAQPSAAYVQLQTHQFLDRVVVLMIKLRVIYLLVMHLALLHHVLNVRLKVLSAQHMRGRADGWTRTSSTCHRSMFKVRLCCTWLAAAEWQRLVERATGGKMERQ